MTTLPLPPTELRFMGEDDERFIRGGDQLVADLRNLCGLGPDSSVLDVGSGYGRVAHALWRAGWRGSYLGLDILRRHVGWCHDTLTPASGGRLEFSHLDVRNDRYNPDGALSAQDVSFDASADVIVLASVFTHMWPDEVRHYLHEIRGALLRGRALATFFCLDDSWQVAMRHEVEPGCRYQNPDNPLHRIGYTPRWIYEAAGDAGLRVYAISLGTWCGRPGGRGYQDTIVLEPA